jgi:hypothetical protein
MHRSHQYRTGQQDDDGFPLYLLQDIDLMQLQTIPNTSNQNTIELVAK